MKKVLGYILIVIAFGFAVTALLGTEFPAVITSHTIVGLIASTLGSLILPAIPFLLGVVLIRKSNEKI